MGIEEIINEYCTIVTPEELKTDILIQEKFIKYLKTLIGINIKLDLEIELWIKKNKICLSE